ncbi:ABC transporter substrate-binding protein [Nodosilinea sp. PGN35]|uniref:ABC transporter substrate-binding protein n=1 Tax=Nodosilinea sp. PGN35 TaxID=3020489 RepID=UPI0023B2C8E3|nr:ABC transporter substrate-binding protein [Nodosilinea sp. TSF1-S3]MDF0368525.1 ABC transporter substrate-binding protein [Nodosilinea sp. TSF1-S3]
MRKNNFFQGLGRRLGLAILASLVAVGALLLGHAWSQQPVTVSFLVRAVEADQMQGLAQQFMAENPDIRIEMVRGPNAADAVENLYTTSFLLGDSPYDILFSDVVWIPKFAAAGWLIDLSDRVSDADLADFLEADVAAGLYQDGLYRMPFRSDMGMLYYRTDLLEQVGLEPPETFDDLIAASEAIQAQTDVDWGFTWQGLQYEGLVTNFIEIIAGYGGFWIDPDSLAVGLDQPAGIQAVEFMKGVIDQRISPPGVTNYIEEDALRQFQNGSAAFLRNWPYAWAEANREGTAVAGNIALKPMVHAEGQQPAACLGGWGFGISSTTPHPEEAWRVVEFFTSPGPMKQFITEFAYVPSRRALFTDPDVLAVFPHYEQLLEVAETAIPRPPVGQYAQLSDILQRYLSAAITNQMTPEAAMTAAAGESRRVLGVEA